MATRVSLVTDLERVRLPNPVMAASGTFGSGQEMASVMEVRRLGGIVTKSVTVRPVRGLPPPRMAETASGMLNAIGLQNPGIEEFVRKDGPFIAQVGVPVFVSVAGKSVEEFAEVAARLREIPQVAAIEANISCPNVERRNQVFACDPDAAATVINRITQVTALPVFAKLTADVTDIVTVARECVRAGATGLSLINTLLGMAIDVDTFRPRLGAVTGGLSGPAIRPIAVRMAWQACRAVRIPVLGIGGIMSAEDALEFLIAGCRAVQVGTANFVDPGVYQRILAGLERYLDRHGFARLEDVVGTLEYPGRSRPEEGAEG